MAPFYILDKNKNVIKARSLNEWAEFIKDDNNKIVGCDILKLEGEEIKISTIFLGIDHSILLDNDPPILFETMIFGGHYDGYQERYSTYQKAVEGHKRNTTNDSLF